MSRYSKKAKRHAKESRERTRNMLKGAAVRSGPVTISYLPGFEPQPVPERKTKFPFAATINGERVIVWDGWIEREEGEPIDRWV